MTKIIKALDYKSEIIIGCMSWGQWGKKLSTSEQADMIEFCVANGNNSFDHADIYGDYTTESEFGIALKESGIERSKIKLISKCGIQLISENRNNNIKHYNYSKDYIIWSAEESLKNLKTDYLDFLLLHRPSPLMHNDEITEAISYLKDSGKIIEFGVSNFTTSQMELLSKYVKINCNQIEFSLTHSTAMSDGTLDYMQMHNIRPMSWSPLGIIYKEESEQVQRIKPTLTQLSDKYNIAEDTLLISWILKHPSTISPVIGTTNKDRMINANKALEVDIEIEDWFTLLEASKGHPVA